jgi:hypothetical protein
MKQSDLDLYLIEKQGPDPYQSEKDGLNPDLYQKSGSATLPVILDVTLR